MKRITIFSSLLVLIMSGNIQATTPDNYPYKHIDRLDRNDDGQLSKRELRNTRYLHRRIDVNDDGRIGKRERRYARKMKNQADINNDGVITKAERRTIRYRLNRLDRRF